MRGHLAAFVLAVGPVAAEPRFEPVQGPVSEHIYSGGWAHFVGGGVAVFDCDANGLPDLFLAGGDGPSRLFRNEGAMQFVALPQPPRVTVTGVERLSDVIGAYPLDLTADGILDLFILRSGRNVVWRGLGDCRFEDMTPGSGLAGDRDGWSTAFTAWWEPGEDRPTLAVGSYVDRSDPDGPFGTCDDNAIFRPAPDGSWAEELLTPGFCPLSMLAHHDVRDRLTLRLSNDRHYYVRGGAEQMWDIGDRRFLGPEDGWDGPMLWGMGIAARDLDADGRDEVMLTSMGDQHLQLAGPDGYRPAPFEMGVTAHRPHVGADGRPSTGWHAQFGDVDNDGMADLFIAKGNVDQMPGMAMEDPNSLLLQRPDGTFEEVSVLAGVASPARSRGAALADLDGDGLLDLVVVNRRAEAELYRNVTRPTGRWLGVTLSQPGGNARAVGARVTVRAGSWSEVQEVVVGGGHAGGIAGPLHFGLPQSGIPEIEVRWPDGAVTRAPAQTGQVVDIRRE